jgi:hypothetical protein
MNLSNRLLQAIRFNNDWDGINRVETDPEDATPQAVPPNPPPERDPNSETAYATLLKEREARKESDRRLRELESRLKAFEGIDPGEYAKAMETAKRQEEFERRQAELEAELEAKVQQKYEPQLRTLQQQLAEREEAFSRYQLDTALEREFYELGGFPGDFKYAALDLRARVKLEDGALVVLEADGRTPAYIAEKGQSRPKTVSELIEELQKSPGFARHFKNSDRPGFSSVAGGAPQVGADASADQIAAALTAYREKNQGYGR